MEGNKTDDGRVSEQYTHTGDIVGICYAEDVTNNKEWEDILRSTISGRRGEFYA